MISEVSPGEASKYCGRAKRPEQKRIWADAVNSALRAGRNEKVALRCGVDAVARPQLPRKKKRSGMKRLAGARQAQRDVEEAS